MICIASTQLLGMKYAFVKKPEEASQEHSHISGEVAKLNALILESQSDSAKDQWEQTRRKFQALEAVLSIKQARLEEQQSLSKRVADGRNTRIAVNIYESQLAFLRQNSEMLTDAQAFCKLRFELHDSTAQLSES